MAVRAARHILWELREYAAASIVGAAADGDVGLALPSRIDQVEQAPKVEADDGLLAVLGDLAGRAALCDLLRRDMESKGKEPREDVHAFAVNYIEGSRADENPRLLRTAASMRRWLGVRRKWLEGKGVFKRYAEEPWEPTESQPTLL